MSVWPTNPMRNFATVAVALVLISGCATRVITARDFQVVRVIDGDTLVIHYDGEPTSIRLPRVNAPERNESGGPAATDALRRLVDGRTVRISFTADRKRDNFGRLLASVAVDGEDVETQLVRAGMAQWRE